MKLLKFIFINFIVAVFADIVLNDIANSELKYPLNSKIIKSLKPYFKNKSIILCGIYAGITICLTLLGVCFLSKKVLNFFVPNNLKELLSFCILAFPIGFIVDIIIDKLKIFGNTLDLYYKEAGAGLWGAIAFLFSIIVSYILQKYLIPVL